jgi:hypothetical protein
MSFPAKISYQRQKVTKNITLPGARKLTLAIDTRSGLMLYFSHPNIVPSLPNAHTTSSAIRRISYFFNMGWILSQYVAGGGMTPPAPITGSPIKAAIVSGPSLIISFSKFSANLVENSSSLSPATYQKLLRMFVADKLLSTI